MVAALGLVTNSALAETRNAYEILGVDQYASLEEVKKARNAHAKEWYMKANQGDPVATQKMVDINWAFEKLVERLSGPAPNQEWEAAMNAYSRAERMNEAKMERVEKLRTYLQIELRHDPLEISFVRTFFDDQARPKDFTYFAMRYELPVTPSTTLRIKEIQEEYFNAALKTLWHRTNNTQIGEELSERLLENFRGRQLGDAVAHALVTILEEATRMNQGQRNRKSVELDRFAQTLIRLMRVPLYRFYPAQGFVNSMLGQRNEGALKALDPRSSDLLRDFLNSHIKATSLSFTDEAKSTRQVLKSLAPGVAAPVKMYECMSRLLRN